MNVDDKNIEPVTDLGLALGYSNQCIQRRLSNGSGAGVNAGSRIDMTYVATDPLSELVWSQQKGLSLKCADGSFCDKKSAILWGVGSSNMDSGSSTEKLINKENFYTSLLPSNVMSEVSGRDNSTGFPASYAVILPLSGSSHEPKTADDEKVEEMKTSVALSFLQKTEDLRNGGGEDACNPVNFQVAEISGTRENRLPISSFLDEARLDVAQNRTSGELLVRARDVADGSRTLGLEIGSVSKVKAVKECEAYDTKMQIAMLLGKEHEESSSRMEKGSKNKKLAGPFVCSLEKPESTADNDMQTPHSENACDVAPKIVRSEPAHKVENNSEQDEEILPRDMTLGVKQSHTNSRTDKYRMKGKAKALSDGNVNEKNMNKKDVSHESVESCNSAGLFSTGNGRQSFESQVIVGDNITKRKIQESPSSSSVVKHDSSFMSWISNMMKGFLKSNEDETPSHALTLANPNRGHDIRGQNLVMSDRNQDNESRTMGFQSIFQSLYCPKTKAQETVNLNADYKKEGFKELELDNKICDINAAPIGCRRVTGDSFKQFLLSNEKFRESTSENEAAQAKDISLTAAADEEIDRSNSAENKNSCNLAFGKEKDGTSSNSSLGKRKRNTAENIDSELPSAGKATHSSCQNSDPLTSLWITRFTPKTSGPLSNLDFCSKGTGKDVDYSSDATRMKTQLQNHPSTRNDKKIMEAQEHSAEDPVYMQHCANTRKASFGFIKGYPDDKSICKLNPILPSPRLRNSEAMASVFAKRLDALKHIMPSDLTDSAARAKPTCFFCGIKGHHLRDCSQITDSELEHLLKNINSCNSAEELPCACIRCLQLNHWAVARPNTSSGVRHKAVCGVSEFPHCKTQINASNEYNPKLSDGSRDSQMQAAGAPTVCGGNDPSMEKNLNLNWKSNGTTAFGKMKLNVKVFEKDTASNSRKNKLKENELTPLPNFIHGQNSDVAKGIFDAVKRLRLSRTDILKWMKSSVPHSHLGGFYLRLRLGKWEEGLGGTGYNVACITGIQRESSTQNSKYSIAVNVGGMKCLVESQYISNHDFLEDELMQWWSAILKSGGKIPTEQDFRLKIKEKKKLGF